MRKLLTITAMFVAASIAAADTLADLQSLLALKKSAEQLHDLKDTQTEYETLYLLLAQAAQFAPWTLMQDNSLYLWAYQPTAKLSLMPEYIDALATAGDASEAHWVTPVGLLYKQGQEHYERGNKSALKYIEKARALAEKAAARREAIRQRTDTKD